MKILISIYLYATTALFIVAVVFTAIKVEATTCYTCTAASSNCPKTEICGMTACNRGDICALYGEICGADCEPY